jgi:hypothetical protein
MSGIFKSAAMSLLRRALQTLLYKYLSDVDVEGVNLPSLYDSDGHSGWGVRLKNVQLRQGVALKELPGKRRHVKKRRKKRPMNTKETKPNDQTDKKDSKVSSNEPGASENDAFLESEATIAPTTITTTTTTTSSSWWPFWRSSTTEAVSTEQHTLLESTNNDLREPSRIEPAPIVFEQDALEETENDEHSLDDEDDEQEEEEDFPYILRLGKGGRIQVLDVRLVGSDIHVMVEDGFLCIEAIRVRPKQTSAESQQQPQQQQGNTQTANGLNSVSNLADAAAATTSAASATVPNTGVPASSDEWNTPGDRVLAENVLARYLSALPNLFLRDLRIQIILRNDIAVDTDESEERNVSGEDDDHSSNELGSNDAMVEISIEFLSITDGGDFLGKYRFSNDDENDGSEQDEDDYNNSRKNNPLSTQQDNDNRYVENEFLTKRIRTGRGPDGGVVIRIIPPGPLLLRETSELHRKTLWARYSWDKATQFCLLRCSGLDVNTRIFLGTRQELEGRNNAWYTDDYDYDMDFNTFAGVDYIAPGGQSPDRQPLPPIQKQSTDMFDDEKFWEYEGAAGYQALDNGIQYSGMKSAFHKVARNMYPSRCSNDHLPCEHCSLCWEGSPGTLHKHSLDNAAPMPGLVISLVTRDPLEVNVDRQSLEVLGNILGLLQKPKVPEPVPNQSNDPLERSLRDLAVNEDVSEPLGASRYSLQVNMADSDDEKDAVGSNTPSYNSETDDIKVSFPVYMQPEKIQILGLHLSEVRFRVHVLDPSGVPDQGLSYCYWDMLAKCITMDHQKLSTSIKSYSDLRLDAGHVIVKEYKGALNRQLLSCGLRPRVVDFDEATIETMRTMEDECNRSAWPSTAAALLDVQPPLETLSYERRDRHGIQFRYINVTSYLADKDFSRTLLNAWLGPSVVNAPYAIKDQVPLIISEARRVIQGQPVSTNPGNQTPDISLDALMKYKLHVDGGSFKLTPKFDVRLPLTTFGGERSLETGIFIESLLERVNFKFNEPSSNSVIARGLTLQQLVALPETVRLAILLFFDDLGPLSRALCVKKESNSFLQCSAVNKALLKVSKRSARRKHQASSNSESRAPDRRQILMTELLKLDDDSLERLWQSHVRFDRQNSNATPKR